MTQNQPTSTAKPCPAGLDLKPGIEVNVGMKLAHAIGEVGKPLLRQSAELAAEMQLIERYKAVTGEVFPVIRTADTLKNKV